jgi:hypothetical protein
VARRVWRRSWAGRSAGERAVAPTLKLGPWLERARCEVMRATFGITRKWPCGLFSESRHRMPGCSKPIEFRRTPPCALLRARAHPLSARSRPLHLHPPHDRSSTPARLSSGRARPGVGTNGSCTVGGQVMLIASSTVGGQVMVENPTRTQGPVLVPATSRLVGAFEHLPARACVSGRPGLALWRRQIDFRRVWGGD